MKTSPSQAVRLLALSRRCGRSGGFTLIELVVALALLALLISIAVPQYFGMVERGRVAVQAQSLSVMRDAIDKFHGDRGRYPNSLDELVSTKYLRAVPVDPVTEQSDWVVIAPRGSALGQVFDVQSAATVIRPPSGRE